MNRDLLSKIMIFVAGAGIGSAITYKLVKKQYDQIIQEEIDSVKEAFSNKPDSTDAEKSEEEEPEPEKVKYRSIVDEAGYATESEKEEEEEDMEKPHIISPEEFGDSDYAVLTLTYFLDGTVLNDRNKIVTNVEELIGEGFSKHFGDYPEDPDTVYVRNDNLGIDFEVLKDYREYSETV